MEQGIIPFAYLLESIHQTNQRFCTSLVNSNVADAGTLVPNDHCLGCYIARFSPTTPS